MYILLALLIFGLLIFIHELGHFLVARACGVQILEFAIGMGPKLISKKSKKSGTVYSLRLFPIGGFVSMLGENGMEAVQGSAEGDAEGEQNINTETTEQDTNGVLSEHAYCNQSVWKRILISLAGPAMNVLLGFVMMFLLVVLSGHAALGTTEVAGFYVSYSGTEEFQGLKPGDVLYATETEENRIRSYGGFLETVTKDEDRILDLYVQRENEETKLYEIVCVPNVALDEASVAEYFKMAGSEASGLRIGDRVKKVNSTSVHTYNELAYEIMNQGYKPMSFTVQRGEETVAVEITVRQIEEQGTVIGELDFIIYREQNFDIGTILKHTWFRSCSTVKMVYDSLFGLISGRYGMSAVSGPVGITKTISDAAKQGFINILYLVTVISINLGIMNLLPIPALDGGHLLIYVIELIRRKPMKQELEGMINLAGLILMLALAVIIAIKDIIAL